jgi:solute carrier family 25 carnitine/acylcarnitine transporter 20/29
MADLHEIRPTELIATSPKNTNLSPSTFESLASGAVGGVSLVLVGHPLDLLKVRLQTASPVQFTSQQPAQKSSMTRIFSSLIKREGVVGIYRGVTAPLIGVAPIFAISIWGYDTGKSLASKLLNLPQSDALVVACGGAFSALPTSLLQVPGDRIKLRLQVSDARKHANPFQETRKIWQEGTAYYKNRLGGFRSLYRGYLVTLAREIPGSAIYFSNYNYMRNLLTANFEKQASFSPDTVTALSILIAGGVAGTLNGLLTLPIDTIKSRFQASSITEFRSARHVAFDLFVKEGPAAYFRGLGPVLLRAFPANAACFSGIELVRYLCK